MSIQDRPTCSSTSSPSNPPHHHHHHQQQQYQPQLQKQQQEEQEHYQRQHSTQVRTSKLNKSSSILNPTTSTLPMNEIFVPNEDTPPNFLIPGFNSTQPPRDQRAGTFSPTSDSWVDLNNEVSVDNEIDGSRVTVNARPIPKVIQGRGRISSPPLVHQAAPRRNTQSEFPLLSISSPSFAPSHPPSSTNKNNNPVPSRRSSEVIVKTREGSGNNRHTAPLNSNASAIPNISEACDDVMDIESCIDNPILAPLGRHVNKKKTSKQVDKGHVDINFVHPKSPATIINEQERESHSPVTSLTLRRRRFDCAQLEHYLQNLQPTLDPHTKCTLQSPLLHLTELDLSRNRLETLPADMTSSVPFLYYLNLSHNQLREVPMELCRLTHLQVLILSQNRIEGPFPHQVCSSLTQLKTLKLCSNQITSLPRTLACLDKLESLSMGSVYGGNLLTSFPANCIQHMGALRELDLSHNKICFLPADIGHTRSHLRQLVASDNKLEAIPKSIGLCKELRNLNLGRNQLTSLPTEIADLKQLDTLDLSENLLCVIPGDVADFLTKTTLLLTGNPFTRGHCDAGRNPVSAIGGLGVNYPSDEERYAAMLKSLSRRAILNSAASSSSGSPTPTLGSLATAAKESQRLSASGDSSYEMDQDERLDYHLYYTRHTLSSRPPSRAESITSQNEYGGGSGGGSDYGSVYGGSWCDPYSGGTGPSTPRVNVEAVLSDIDSFFDYIPSLNDISNTQNITNTITTISPSSAISEPSIFESPPLGIPSTPNQTTLLSPTPAPALQAFSPTPSDNQVLDQLVESGSSTTSLPSSDQPIVNSQLQGFFPSLKELAARAVLHIGEPLPINLIPEAVIDYLEPGARPCALCRRPYVKEWVSSVRVKSYQGHPAVARRIRFCSVGCWKNASEQLEAEESGKSVPSVGVHGATTGHLPPVVTMATDSSGIEENTKLLNLGSTLAGTRVCKGGQTYWPVIGRAEGGKLQRSASSSSSLKGSVGEAESMTKSNVCSGGCLGGGVCEW